MDAGKSVHCLGWSPIQTSGLTWQKFFLLCVFPAACCCKVKTHGVSTMRTFWQYLALGFTALVRGVHPRADPHGDPWPAGSYQAELAGAQIAGGRFFCCVLSLSLIHI